MFEILIVLILFLVAFVVPLIPGADEGFYGYGRGRTPWYTSRYWPTRLRYPYYWGRYPYYYGGRYYSPYSYYPYSYSYYW